MNWFLEPRAWWLLGSTSEMTDEGVHATYALQSSSNVKGNAKFYLFCTFLGIFVDQVSCMSRPITKTYMKPFSWKPCEMSDVRLALDVDDVEWGPLRNIPGILFEIFETGEGRRRFKM